MLIELIEIKYNYENKYSLSKIYVNPLHIVSLSEDSRTQRALSEGGMNLELSQDAKFTKLTLNESRSFNEMIVVGAPEQIHEKIYNSKKKMLLRD
tara:strand:+ start:270 stop:554 length:285 start_codon:yes stop_codon:yes gene_type:complete